MLTTNFVSYLLMLVLESTDLSIQVKYIGFLPLNNYVSQKRSPFYFSNDSQKLTDFNDFWCAKS